MSLAGSTNPIVSVLAGGRDMALADSGNYFMAITPTPGTGIITGSSVQAFTETTPYMTVYNGNVGGGPSIYPVFLRTHLTVVGATASLAEYWTFTLDTGNRYTSGGTALTINNTNMSNANASLASIFVGAITASAASGSRRVVDHVVGKDTVIEVVHDRNVFNWGGNNAVSPSSTASNTTTPTYAAYNLAPMVIGPGQSMVIVRWAASQTTGSTNEFQFSYIEK